MATSDTTLTDAPLRHREVVATWWPLALSWLLMTGELVLTSAVISRLPAAEVNLAAWGIVFNLSIVIQAPATMLLAASTALVIDAPSYRRLRNLAAVILATLTAVHAVLAFTPLFDVVVGGWIGAPPEVAEAARLAAMLVVPWSLCTGSRRFFHGILIRHGRSRTVVLGTVVRLTGDCVILGAGLVVGGVPGAALAAFAMTVSVFLEALYTWFRVRPVIAMHVLREPGTGRPFTLPEFARFYTPLVLTTLLSLATVTIVSAAITRMPDPLVSLAAWPVVFSFLLIWQSIGFAYQEVVISLLRRRGGTITLESFTRRIAVVVSVALTITAATPLAYAWFRYGAGLSGELTDLARIALWFGLATPALRAVQSWQFGVLMFGRRTGAVLESVLIFLATTVLVLAIGLLTQAYTGLYVGMAAYAAGFVAQTAWLHVRTVPVLAMLRRRGTAEVVHP
ncbi:hypothetical protein BH23DEI1_BH23DEI1_07220 [soil metagenome]